MNGDSLTGLGNHISRIDKLRYIERDRGYFDYAPFGWSIWRVLRFYVFRRADAVEIYGQSPRTLRRVLRSAVGVLLIARAILQRQEANILYKSCRTDLRIKTSAGYFDTFLDTALSRRADYLKMEEVNSESFSLQASQALVKSDINPATVNFLAHICAKISRSRRFKEFTSQIAEEIRQACGLELNANEMAQLAARTYWQEKIYSLILRRLSIKVVVLTDTGDYGLRLAALKLGISVIEIQHGVFDESHPDAVPGWVAGGRFRNIEPDILIVRGDFSKAVLRNSRLFPDRLLACGYEPIDRARALMASTAKSPVADSQIRVLFSSQGYDRDRLSKWILDFIDAKPLSVRLRVQLKLHPFYDTDESVFHNLRQYANVDVVPGSDERSIYELLQAADVHMSISSNAHYDAAALGVPSLIIPLTGFEIVAKFADNISIYLVSDATSAWNYISDLKIYRRAQANMFFYCEDNFGDRVERILESTLRS